MRPAAKGFTINTPNTALTAGSWKAQGLPFYNGTVSYAKTFDVNNSSEHFRNVKAYPAGERYKQLDDGLMDDFVLEEGK